MKIGIRPAQLEDAPGLILLNEAIRQEEIYSLSEPGENSRSLSEEKEWIESIRENPNHLLLVATQQKDTPEGTIETVVGSLELHSGNRKRISHTAEFGMAVARSFRNQGIGKMLIKSMLQWAHENPQIEKISLKVHHDNDRAIHLYQSMGFVREGVLKKDLKYGPNRYVDTVIFSLWV